MQNILFDFPPVMTINTRQELANLIYSNGGYNPPTIVFHEDGGHGWLQVPHSLIQKLGIADKISAYSYRDTTSAFLEEDCDLTVFMIAAGIDHTQPLFKDFWQLCPQEYKEHSPIRRKAAYR